MRRLLASLLLIALAPLGFGAALTMDVSGAKPTVIEKQMQGSVTSTENTVVFTVGSEDRKVQVYSTAQPWGISNATGDYSTKKPIQANWMETITVVGTAKYGGGTTTRTFYIQAALTTDTLYFAVVD